MTANTPGGGTNHPPIAMPMARPTAPAVRRRRRRMAVSTLAAIIVGLGIGSAVPAPAGAIEQASLGSLASPAMTITASTTTTVGLQVFANVNLSGGSNPTGTITYRLFAPGDSACNAVIFTSTVAVAGTSMNSDRFTTSQAGTYRWRASYSGDANNSGYGPTSCSDPNAAVIVSPASTGLAVTAQPFTGGTIRASANLGGYHPTGTITFLLTAPGDQFCSATPVFSSTVAIAGAGSYVSAPYTPKATGTYKWRATYSGDANNYLAGPTACLDQNASVTVDSIPPPAPAIAFSPTTVTFADQGVGTTGAAQAITVSNPGNAGLAIRSIATAGANPSDFRTSADTCTGATIVPGGTCSVAVSFAPAGTGARAAQLAVADNAPGSPQTVALNGRGITSTATFLNPADGQANVDPTRPFRWSTVAPAQGYYLVIGTTRNGADLVNSGVLSPAQASYSVPDLPAGPTLYATLLTEIEGGWTHYQAVTFTAAPGHATLINPVNGQQNVNTTSPFTWSTLAAAQGYYLIVGTTAYGADLGNSGVLAANQSSFNVSDLPAGQVLYATLFTEVNGSWSHYQVVGFVAAVGHATFTNPVNGQQNVDTSHPVTWSTVPGAQGYYLVVGTTQFGADLVNSGVLPANQSSFSVPALPGGTVLYATMFTEVNGGWARYEMIGFVTR